jgi:hypothetical protein
MRKFMLIAAIALTSTTASAGPSLSLASADAGQGTIEQQTKPQSTDVSKSPAANPVPQTQSKTPAPDERRSQTARPKRGSAPIEARIIYELHRHGIYW